MISFDPINLKIMASRVLKSLRIVHALPHGHVQWTTIGPSEDLVSHTKKYTRIQLTLNLSRAQPAPKLLVPGIKAVDPAGCEMHYPG